MKRPDYTQTQVGTLKTGINSEDGPITKEAHANNKTESNQKTERSKPTGYQDHESMRMCLHVSADV